MRKIAFGLAAAAAMMATPALAGTATGTVQVTLNIGKACSVTAQPLSFGSVTTLANDILGSSASTVTCTPGADYTVALNDGTHNTATQRALQSSAGDKVNYNLYSDSARASLWSSANSLSGTGTGSAQAWTIYGKVPGGQGAVPAGDYTDTVTITVTY